MRPVGRSRPRRARRASCGSNTGPTRTTPSSSCERGISGASSSGSWERRSTRRRACSGSRSRSRATCSTPFVRAWPPGCPCACSSLPRRCGASPRSRQRASRQCCTTRRAASCTRAAPRSRWRAWRGPRAPPFARESRCALSATAQWSLPTALASMPIRCWSRPARGLADSCRPRRSARRSRSTRTCACRRPACPCGSTTSMSTGSVTTRAPGSRWADMRLAPTSTPTMPRRARRPRQRCVGSPMRRAGACLGCPGPMAR